MEVWQNGGNHKKQTHCQSNTTKTATDQHQGWTAWHHGHPTLASPLNKSELIWTWEWVLPTRRYDSAGNSDRNVSVRLSVRLSVTRRYCVKTKKASGMISSLSGSPETLVFWRQISSPNSKGFPPNGGLKHGSVGKIQRFSSSKRQYLENGSRYGQSYY